VTGTAAVHRSPAAIRASPAPIVHRGLYRCSSRSVTGISGSAMPLNSTNAIAAGSGVKSRMAVSRMLVE
jgi:hypothetical protein